MQKIRDHPGKPCLLYDFDISEVFLEALASTLMFLETSHDLIIFSSSLPLLVPNNGLHWLHCIGLIGQSNVPFMNRFGVHRETTVEDLEKF